MFPFCHPQGEGDAIMELVNQTQSNTEQKLSRHLTATNSKFLAIIQTALMILLVPKRWKTQNQHSGGKRKCRRNICINQCTCRVVHEHMHAHEYKLHRTPAP